MDVAWMIPMSLVATLGFVLTLVAINRLLAWYGFSPIPYSAATNSMV